MTEEEETQTAMLLTKKEWDELADICLVFMSTVPGPMPDHLKLCNRIIEVAAD